MSLVNTHEMFNVLLIEFEKACQSVIQSCDIVQGIKDLKIALSIGPDPCLFLPTLNGSVLVKPLLNAAFQHFLEVEFTQLNVNFEVVIYFAQVVLRLI
jgi:hypothetical protein